MEPLVRALVSLIGRNSFKGGNRATPRAVEVDLRGAPPCVVELVEALASNHYHVDLGEYSLFDSGTGGAVRSIAPTLTFACTEGHLDLDTILESHGSGGTPFDPNRTVELGPDAGGMSELAVSWSGGELGLVVVEYEDPTQDNVLTHLRTPQAFFAFLDDKNADGDDEPLDLEALRAAASVTMAR